MSKRDLKKYLTGLDKEQLEIQIIELYEKFAPVKTYYDFVFNPKEEKLVQESKLKINNEYFPARGKRAKARRSVAQKYIKHFILLGVDSFIIADLMLFTVETGQKFSAKNKIRFDSFYKSMFNSFVQAIDYMIENGILYEFKTRILAIKEETVRQKWYNSHDFILSIERLED